MDFLSGAYAVDATRAAAANLPSPASVPEASAPEEVSSPPRNHEENIPTNEGRAGAARGMTREEVMRATGKQKAATVGGEPGGKRRKVTAQRQPGSAAKKTRADATQDKGKEKEKTPEGCKIRTSSAGHEQVVFPMGMSYRSPDFLKHLSTLVSGSVVEDNPYDGMSSAQMAREVLSSLTHSMRGVLSLNNLNKLERQKSSQYHEEKARADLATEALKHNEAELAVMQTRVRQLETDFLEMEQQTAAAKEEQRRQHEEIIELGRERDEARVIASEANKAKEAAEQETAEMKHKYTEAQLILGFMLGEFRSGIKAACVERFPDLDFSFVDSISAQQFQEVVLEKTQKRLAEMEESQRSP